MLHNPPRLHHPTEQCVASDRVLSAQIHRHDIVALRIVYARYATLVFTLLHHAVPVAAESLIEGIFLTLWQRGTATLVTDVVSTLLHLTGDAVMQYDAAHGSASPQPRLPALIPFSQLPTGVFDVLVLKYLGKLTVAELAVALEREEAVVRHALARGLAAIHAEQRGLQLDRGA